MKQSFFSTGQITTIDDLDFIERSKQFAIEQTRFDLLSSRGVVTNSGTTPGHQSDPLRVYLSGAPPRTVNIYGGIAYDAFEGRSRRIWVPNDPTDIPLNPAEAVSNHDNIDMQAEVQTKDFGAAFRPSRLNLKTFAVTDPIGNYYVCIRYDYGTYDPITIEMDGHQENSKMYESYLISVSKSTAAQLTATTGIPWIQLATLLWDGLDLTLESDDRVLASATVTVTEEAVVRHQDLFHSNCIVSQDTTKLNCTIPIAAHPARVDIGNTTFSAGEGMLINGVFVQLMSSSSITFSPVMGSGVYYLYVDSVGVPRASQDFSLASAGCVLGSVYYDAVADALRISNAIYDFVVRDRRSFGSIGKYDLSSKILGLGYLELDDLKIKDLSNELISHRDNSHGNGLYAHSAAPYVAGVGSFGATKNGLKIEVNDLAGGDVLYLDGWEIRSRSGPYGFVDFSASPNATYLVYAQRQPLGLDNHMYDLRSEVYNPPVAETKYPICVVEKAGGVLGNPRDLRVYGAVGYYHVQRNNNSANRNTLPQLLTCMHGSTPVIAADDDSDVIYLTDDWGVAGSYGGGGTASGKPVFAALPSIQVYSRISGWPSYDSLGFGGYQVGVNFYGYYLIEVSPTGISFKIRNFSTLTAHQFYWIAIGPPCLNDNVAVLKGRDNPTYG